MNPRWLGGPETIVAGRQRPSHNSTDEEEVIEAAGVEFAAENGAGACVRLRKVKLTRPFVVADRSFLVFNIPTEG